MDIGLIILIEAIFISIFYIGNFIIGKKYKNDEAKLFDLSMIFKWLLFDVNMVVMVIVLCILLIKES